MRLLQTIHNYFFDFEDEGIDPDYVLVGLFYGVPLLGTVMSLGIWFL